MLCKQCGSPNQEGSQFCMKCGASLDTSHPAKPKGKKPGLVAGLIAGGILLIAAAVVLFLLFTGVASVSGPWHSDLSNQMLRFHDDGTVVVRTAQGDSEATYVFDKGKGEGVISIGGVAVSFTVAGDRLTLNSIGSGAEFVRGDMEIVPAMAQATPTLTPIPTLTPMPTLTPTSTPAFEPTVAPTLAPSVPTKTPKPSPASTPAPSLVPVQPPALTLKPGLDPEDLLPLLDSVEGEWYGYGLTLTFYDDNTYTIYFGTMLFESGDYSYEAVSKEGQLIESGGTVKFTVSGDMLTLETGGTFIRAS